MPQGHVPIPRYRGHSGFAVLAHGFRPFFFLAGLWAAGALLLSIGMLQGHVALPTHLDPVTWHLHEMLFGFVAATLTGFLLTAIPNWTGRLPLQGAPLLGLVGLWIAGRAALAVSAVIGAWPAALIDVAFLLVVVVVALREIITGRNWRNLPIVAAVTLFLCGNILIHAEALELIETTGLGQRLSIATIVALISLVGGRVVPSFTRNWLVKQGASRLPASFGIVDRATLLITLLALAVWVVLPDGALTGGLIALAALASGVRLARWQGWATSAEPLVWVLHLGYFWIPAGLALLALSEWWPALPPSGALHALTAGAIGTMTVAVMSRATLGHTGRALHAGAGLAIAYGLISLAAATRIISAAVESDALPLLWIAAASWIGAFAIYLAICGPMLLFQRPDGKEG